MRTKIYQCRRRSAVLRTEDSMRRRRCAVTNALAGVGTESEAKTRQIDDAMLGTDSSSHEAWIKQLGQNLTAALQGGDRETAYRFQSAMFVAIRNRHPAQQQRRFMEIDYAIWGQS